MVEYVHGATDTVIKQFADADGTENWSQTLSAFPRRMVVDENGDVYTYLSSGVVEKRLNSDGTQDWSATPTNAGSSQGLVEVTANYVYVYSQNGSDSILTQFDRATGAENWQYNPTSSAFDVIESLEVDASENAYFTGGSGFVASVDSTGAERWTSDAGTGSGVAATYSPDTTRLYVHNDSQEVYEIDPSDGTVTTTYTLSTSANLRELIVNNGGNFYGFDDDGIIEFDSSFNIISENTRTETFNGGLSVDKDGELYINMRDSTTDVYEIANGGQGATNWTGQLESGLAGGTAVGFPKYAPFESQWLTVDNVSATPISANASMNTTALSDVETISATQFSATATMLAAVAEDVVFNAEQNQVAVTMNDAVINQFEIASQFSATASANQLLTQDLAQPVEIVAGDGTVFNATNIRLDDGRPEFVRGSTITRVLFFDDSGGKLYFQNKTPQETYEELRDDYGRYLSEKNIKYGVSHEGVPYFWQNTNPRSPVASYLWELRPKHGGGLDDWWVLPLNINDVTRMAGPSYALEVELFVIAPTSEGDRAYIKQTYEVEK